MSSYSVFYSIHEQVHIDYATRFRMKPVLFGELLLISVTGCAQFINVG